MHKLQAYASVGRLPFFKLARQAAENILSVDIGKIIKSKFR